MSPKLKAWVQASRAPFFVATIIPLGLGGIIARKEGGWDFKLWAVVFLASFLVHLATNLANDFFEYSSGADDGNSIGGSRVLQEGKISLHEIRNALVVLYLASFLLGIYILYASKVWWLAPMMLFAFFSSLFYTGPPIRYGYHGLGEIFVGINMGFIMIIGTSATLLGHFSKASFWLSIPIAFMVALILFYQSLSDIEDDKSVGKITTAVRLGKPDAIWGFRLIVMITLLSIVLLVRAGFLHWSGLFSLLSLFFVYKTDQKITHSPDWKELHDQGGDVRLFYFVNGLVMIIAVSLCC